MESRPSARMLKLLLWPGAGMVITELRRTLCVSDCACSILSCLHAPRRVQCIELSVHPHVQRITLSCLKSLIHGVTCPVLLVFTCLPSPGGHIFSQPLGGLTTFHWKGLLRGRWPHTGPGTQPMKLFPEGYVRTTLLLATGIETKDRGASRAQSGGPMSILWASH